MNLLVILAGLVVLIIIISLLSKGGQKKAPGFYSAFTPNGLQVLRKLEEYLDNNKALPYLGYYKIYDEFFGKLETNSDAFAYAKAMGIHNYEDEPENSLRYMAGDYFDTLQWDLEHRYRNEFRPMNKYDEAEAKDEFGLNIHSDEYVHENINRVDWFEEKTVTTSINYGGYRYNAGQGLHYTFGSLNVMRNTRNYFSHVDRGSLYITNKRIIFVGKEKRQNRTVDLDDILEFNLFRDGILIGKANGRKPLIEFAPYILQAGKAPNIRDHVSRVARALDRVICKTQNESLEPVN